MKISGERLESLYTTMVKIRRFDERTVELFNQGLVKGTAHSYVGEEAVAAGVCAQLTDPLCLWGRVRVRVPRQPRTPNSVSPPRPGA